jgi:hypothetical protein
MKTIAVSSLDPIKPGELTLSDQKLTFPLSPSNRRAHLEDVGSAKEEVRLAEKVAVVVLQDAHADGGGHVPQHLVPHARGVKVQLQVRLGLPLQGGGHTVGGHVPGGKSYRTLKEFA